MSDSGQKAEIAKHAVAVILGRGAIRVSQFLAFLILGRLLTPAEFGWFGILTTAIALAAIIGSLGLRQAFAYEIGQKRISSGAAAGTALTLWPLMTVFSALVLFALYGHQLPSLSPVQAAGIITVGVAGSLLLTLLQGINLGQGHLSEFSLSDALPRIALAVLAVALALAARVSLQSALWAYVSGFALTAPLLMWLAMRGAGSLSVSFSNFSRMLRYGLIFALNLLLVTLCARLSMFVIGHISGPAAAGEFYAAVRVNEMFLEGANAFAMVLFSNAARQDRDVSVLDRNARIACWMFWLFAILAGVIALTAPLVITAMLGPQYAAAGPALQILALSLAPVAACKVIYSTLAGSGHPGYGTLILLICVTTNGALAIILVPAIHIIGGVLALVVSQYILFTGYVIVCRVRFKVPVRSFIIPRRSDMKMIARSIPVMRRLSRRSPGGA